jgi:hypothetical protein
MHGRTRRAMLGSLSQLEHSARSTRRSTTSEIVMHTFFNVAARERASALLVAALCLHCGPTERSFQAGHSGSGGAAAGAGSGNGGEFGTEPSGGRESGGGAAGSASGGEGGAAGTSGGAAGTSGGAAGTSGGAAGTSGGAAGTSGGAAAGGTMSTGGAQTNPASGGSSGNAIGGGGVTNNGGGGHGGAATPPSCTVSSQCADPGEPICRSGACASCKTAGECVTKDSTAPNCDAASGKCVQCNASSQCTNPATPICSSAFVCVGCGTVGLSSNACSQKSALTPICGPAGACVQCTIDSQCSGATPICGSAGTCQACSSDAQCVKKLGANPGVCMAHQDGRCATDAETVYVEDSTSCSTTVGATSGTNAKPYCDTETALSALSASRRLMVARGSAAGFDYSSSAGQLTVVGQLNGALYPGSTSSCVSVSDGANLYIRDFVCNTNFNAPAITVNSATIYMQRMVIFNSGGGILLDASNFEIIDSIISDNQLGTIGATPFGGIGIANPPSTGLKVLQNISLIDQNNPNDIACSAAITGSGIYAPDNKVGTACGVSTCSTLSASCGSSLIWVNPGD